MENEQLILNLLKRVSILEERVDILETHGEGNNESSEPAIRKLSKNLVVRELSEHLQNHNIDISKRSNSQGGGLALTYFDGKVRTALLKMSRNYVIDNPGRFAQKYIWRSWHRVNITDDTLNNFDFYIFSIENWDEFIFITLTKNVFKKLLKNKEKDKNGNYYFYFVKTLGGDILEDREQVIDVSSFLNNWTLFEEEN